MRRQRVLTVVDSLGDGSVARTVVALQGRLSRRRFDLRVASLSEPDHLARDLRGMKVPVYELGLSGPRDLLHGTLRLRRLISSLGIDLVHTHLTMSGVAGRLAAWGKTPVVSSLYAAGPGADGGWGERSLQALDRLTARRIPRKLLAPSEAARKEHERRGFHQVEVLHDCIDIEGFRTRLAEHDRVHVRTAHGLGSAETVFLHVGTFRRDGGQDDLLHGFRVALTERSELRLLLAGDGPALPEARALAEELDLQDAVVFLGDVADPTPLYVAADAFVLPSRTDLSGMALLQPMAAGLPAVASDVEGIGEVATEATAMLVDTTREEELARAMLTVARDPGLRRRMGEAARERASRFDVSRCVGRLEAIYEGLAR